MSAGVSDVTEGVCVAGMSALADRERGGAEEAHDERHAVPEEPDADGLAGRHVERAEEQHQETLADPEARERDGQHLRRGDGGEEREHGTVGDRDAQRVDRAPHRDQHRDLVGDRRHQHARDPPGLPTDAVDTDVHRADESHPVLVGGEAARESRAGRDDEDDQEPDDGRAGDDERDPGVVELEQRGLEREPEERQEWERDEAAQALDDHRRERDVAGARALGGPADPQDVAADGRRQHVAHELTGEVVREQRAQRHVGVEHREHPLPAPRREDEPAEREEEAGGQERQRAGVGVLGLDVVGRDLRDEQREQRGADDDPHAQLRRTREVEVVPGARAPSVSAAAIPSCYGFAHRRIARP